MARQLRSSSYLIYSNQETPFKEENKRDDLSSEYIQFKMKQLDNLNLNCSGNSLFKKDGTGNTRMNRHLRGGSDNTLVQFMVQKYSAYQSKNTPLKSELSPRMKIEMNELKEVCYIDRGVYDKTHEEAWELEPGKYIAYRYQIIKLLGEGAFAKVYECVDHKINERIALKVLK